jgi:hypothetical protein
VAIESVRGRVASGKGDLKAGDLVSLAQPLRTDFGAHAVIEAGGARFVLHQETQLALGAGPAARIAAGKVFVRSVPGLRVETPAGTAIPIGTEFTVEVSGETTVVAVREGAVQFSNDQGKAVVRKDQALSAARGNAPGKPGPVPADAFAWASAASLERFLILYPGQRKSGVVICAPHITAQDELHVGQFAAGVSRRLGVGLVAAHGYDGSKVVLPGRPGEDRELFERHLGLVREASGSWPARLVVVVHAKLVGDPAHHVIEVGTAGFTVQEEEDLKRDFAAIVERRAPAERIRMVCEHSDPDFPNFTAGTVDYRRAGIFKEGHAARGLRLRVPNTVRYRDAVRAEYEAIVAEWLEKIR